jgi:replicative DNA helicase
LNKFELAIQTEGMLLGSILQDSSLMDEVMIQPNQLISLEHKQLLKSMYQLKKEGKEVSPYNLSMLGESVSRNYGGDQYLYDLIHSVPSIHGFNTYQQNIINFYTVQQAQMKVNTFTENTKEIHDIKELSTLIQEVNKLEAATVRKNASFQALLAERVEHHEKSPLKGLSGVDTGFLNLNMRTDGWQPSDLIIVGARPSVGKTALVLNCILNSAKKNNDVYATFFSIEMAKGLIIDRFIASEGKIKVSKMRNPNKSFVETDWTKYTKAVGNIEKLNIDIRDENTVPEIRSVIRRNAKDHTDKKHVVAIDFLTLIKHTEPTGNRHQEITDIIRDLKQIAKDLNVPIIVIAQLNRGVENRSNKRPNMSDLTESGSIEQIADVIMLLYREDYYDKDKEEKPVQDIIEIDFAKNRQGGTGLVKLKFVKETNTFYDLVN